MPITALKERWEYSQDFHSSKLQLIAGIGKLVALQECTWRLEFLKLIKTELG